MHFSPSRSTNRVHLLQSLCEDDQQILVFIPGVDGKHNVGSQAVVKYLFLGASGRDLLDDTIAAEDAALEDCVVYVSKFGVTVYYNQKASHVVGPMVAQWPNVDEQFASPRLIQGSVDKEEMFKISCFVDTLRDVTSVAMPLGGNNTLWNTCLDHNSQSQVLYVNVADGTNPVEQWPLVQAYALDELNTDGFFTSKKVVRDIAPLLGLLFRHVDSTYLDTTLSHLDDQLFFHWGAMLRLANNRPLAKRQAVTETQFGEPLLSFYDFAMIRRGADERARGHMRGARILFGARSDDVALESSENVTVYHRDEDSQVALHATVQAEDPETGVRCARTYFLTKPENTAADAASLMLLYQALVFAHQHVLGVIHQGPAKGAPYLEDQSSDRATRRLHALAEDAMRRFLNARQDGERLLEAIEGTWDLGSALSFDLEPFDATGECARYSRSATFSSALAQFRPRTFFYCKLSLRGVPSSDPQHGEGSLGSLTIGDTVIQPASSFVKKVDAKLAQLYSPEVDLASSADVEATSGVFVVTGNIPTFFASVHGSSAEIDRIHKVNAAEVADQYELSLGRKVVGSEGRISGTVEASAGAVTGDVIASVALRNHATGACMSGALHFYENGVVFESKALGTSFVRLSKEARVVTRVATGKPSAEKELLVLQRIRTDDLEDDDEAGFERIGDSLFTALEPLVGCSRDVIAIGLDPRHAGLVFDAWKTAAVKYAGDLEFRIEGVFHKHDRVSGMYSCALVGGDQTSKALVREVLSEGLAFEDSLASNDNGTQQHESLYEARPNSVPVHLVVGSSGSGKGSIGRWIRGYYRSNGIKRCTVYDPDSEGHLGSPFDVTKFNKFVQCNHELVVLVCPSGISAMECGNKILACKRWAGDQVYFCSSTAVVSCKYAYRDETKLRLIPQVQAQCENGYANVVILTGSDAVSDDQNEILRQKVSTWNPNASVVEVPKLGVFAGEEILTLSETVFEDTVDFVDGIDVESPCNGLLSDVYHEYRQQARLAMGSPCEAITVSSQKLKSLDMQAFQAFVQAITTTDPLSRGRCVVVAERRHSENDAKTANPTFTGIRFAQQVAERKVNDDYEYAFKQLSKFSQSSIRTNAPVHDNNTRIHGECWYVGGYVTLEDEATHSPAIYEVVAVGGDVQLKQVERSPNRSLVFMGRHLEREELMKYLQACGKLNRTAIPTRTRVSVTEEEMMALTKKLQNSPSVDLPSGFWFDGQNYIDHNGQVLKYHPCLDEHLDGWLEEENQKIRRFNAARGDML